MDTHTSLLDAREDCFARTRLYAIAPMGENGHLEGLISYIVRLSAAHVVRPRDLIRYEIAPEGLACLHGLRQPGFNHQYALTVDGLGHYAEQVVVRLEKLTGRQDLRVHTLISLRELFASNGPGLMNPKRKWCPSCLAEQGASSYSPLLWSMQTYQLCVTHGRALVDKCPHCTRAQPFIPRLPSFAICEHCHLSLALDPPTIAQTDPSQLWTSRALENLIAFSSRWRGTNLLARFHRRLQSLIDARANGNRAAFTRQVGFGVGAFKNWFTKDERPTLPQFLRLSQALKLMPSALLGEEAVTATLPVQSVTLFGSKRTSSGLGDSKRRRNVGMLLNAAIEQDTAEPLSTLCVRIGLSRYAVRYHFPLEYAALCGRWKAAQGDALKSTRAARIERIDQALKALGKEGTYPSRARVAKYLIRENDSMRDPSARKHLRERVQALYRGEFGLVPQTFSSPPQDESSRRKSPTSNPSRRKKRI